MTRPAWATTRLLTIGALLLAMVVGALLLARPVIGWYQKRTDRAEAKTELATDNAVARGLEVEGGQEIQRQVETFHTNTIEVRERLRTVTRTVEARPDAQDPLDPVTAATLRAHDLELCGMGPDCSPDDGGASSVADARDRGEAVQALRPASKPDER